MIRQGRSYNSVVIASDHEKNGTNALFVRPPGLFSYAYGENSFGRHQQLARLSGATVHVYESERLQLDLTRRMTCHCTASMYPAGSTTRSRCLANRKRKPANNVIIDIYSQT